MYLVPKCNVHPTYIHTHTNCKMGALWSHPQTDKQPSTSFEPVVTHIVVYQSISTKMEDDVWIYQSKINTLPITYGQWVAIYHNAADAL